MPYSMSTRRDTRLPLTTGPQAVTVYGYDEDGGQDGLPMVVARGQVHVHRDGPDQCRVTADDGTRYSTVESSWDPLRHEWVCEAVKVDDVVTS